MGFNGSLFTRPSQVNLEFTMSWKSLVNFSLYHTISISVSKTAQKAIPRNKCVWHPGALVDTGLHQTHITDWWISNTLDKQQQQQCPQERATAEKSDLLLFAMTRRVNELTATGCFIFLYPLVNTHSYWKLPFIVDFPIKTCDFP